MNFSKQELEHAAQLHHLVMRQLSMGLPEGLALTVLATACGQVAHEQGVPREELQRLVPLMEQAWDGRAAGVAQAEKERAGEQGR